MFGYVIANTAEMSAEDQARYRGCYCGLCRTLKERFGSLSRITLNYDLTFLVLLLSSLYEPNEKSGTERCAVHALKSHDYWTTRFTDYAADMTVALTYQSCLDDWKDERSPVRFAEAKMLKKGWDAVCVRHPRQCGMIESCLAELSELEKEGCANVDGPANAFGKLLAEIFVYDEEDWWADALRRTGYSLGKFIYVLDASVDLKRDLKRGSYNPLKNLETADTRQVLSMLIGSCTAQFEKLPLIQDVGILRNILYSGVWSRYRLTDTETEKEEE